MPTHRRTRCRPASTLSPPHPSQGLLPTFLAGFVGRALHPRDDVRISRSDRTSILAFMTFSVAPQALRLGILFGRVSDLCSAAVNGGYNVLQLISAKSK